MIVQDVIDMARYSEAAGTAIKDNQEAILLFLNAGMLELYKRFPVETSEYLIPLVEGVVTYTLPADFMYCANAYEEVPEAGEKRVAEVPINDEYDPRSIFFPNHKEVIIPDSENGAYISLVYIPKPAQYTAETVNEELALPDTLVDCLLHFIGYKAHLGIRGDGQAENNAHYLRFERSCDKAQDLGVAHPVDSLRSPNKLYDRGFV